MTPLIRSCAAAFLLVVVLVGAAPEGAVPSASGPGRSTDSAGASQARPLAGTIEGVTVGAKERRWLTGNALLEDLLAILPRAERRILVVMFLASSSDQVDHPVRRLITELKAAHARGVDVLVILDDLYLPKNETAYRQLQEAGIDVRWDPSGTLTHTKVVVADETVWVGSANWTSSALTGGNLETTLRVTNGALADQIYDVRRGHMGSADSRALASAGRAILAEAASALAGDDGGMARRNLAASGLDPEALVAAGVGVMAGDPATFRTRTLARLGAGTGWARWGYPPFRENSILLPTKSGQLLAIDAASWTVIAGDARDAAADPRLGGLQSRIRGSAPES